MKNIEVLKQMAEGIAMVMLTIISTVLAEQTFVETPKSTNATVNSTVIFKCVIRDKAGEVQWTKDGVMMGYEREYPGWPRHSVIGGVSQNIYEYSMKIVDVQLSDDGAYNCHVIRTDTNAYLKSDPAYLTVLVPPDPPVILGGTTQQVVLGQAKNISCVSTNGKPGATITWAKGSEKLTNNIVSRTEKNEGNDKREKTTSHVLITPTVEDHGKRIECSAYNQVLQQPLKTVATLDVQFAPVITMNVNITRTLKEFDYVRFICAAKANPSIVTWKWSLDGETLDNPYDYLDIPKISRDLHRSILKCEATNSIGKSEGSNALHIEYGPAIKEMEAVIGVDIGQTVTLTCEADGNPEPSIIWRRGHYPDALGTENKYTVNVQTHNLGLYTCTASSVNAGFNAVTAERFLVVNDKPKITSSPKQYGAEGSTSDIVCKAQSVPKADEVTWFRNNKEIDFASSNRYSFSEVNEINSVVNTLHIQDSDSGDFGVYNCTVHNSKGMDFMEITLIKKAIVPLSYIIGGVIGGVAAIFIIAIACVLYHRYKTSDNESYAETDSNTEIKKREKTDSPTEFHKGTLMDQWRQDLNYHCPTDFDEVYGKMNGMESKVTSGYGTLRSEHYGNGYDNHNGHLFSDYIHRSDETVSSDSHMDSGINQYGTSTFRSRPDYQKTLERLDPDPYGLPPADPSSKLATNV